MFMSYLSPTSAQRYVGVVDAFKTPRYNYDPARRVYS